MMADGFKTEGTMDEEDNLDEGRAGTLYNMSEASEAGKAVYPILQPKDKHGITLPINGAPVYRGKFVKPIPSPVSFEDMRDTLTTKWPKWGITDERWRFYALAAYLLGARTTETLRLRRRDFTPVVEDGYKFMEVKLITLKRKSHWVGADGKKIKRKYVQEEDGQFSAVPIKNKPPEGAVNVKPAMGSRFIRIPLERLPWVRIDETPLINEFVRYVENKDMEQYLFNFSKEANKTEKDLYNERVMAWNRMRQIDFGPLTIRYYDKEGHRDEEKIVEHFFGFNHYFRHVRLTVLAMNYHFSDKMLQHWCGWSSPEPASTYVQTGGKDISSAFLAGRGRVGENGV